MSKLTDKNLKALLAQGLTQSEIARRCSCSRQAVHFRLNHGSKPKEHLRWAKHTRVYWFFIQGLDMEEIERRVGYRRRTILDMIQRHFPHLCVRGPR